MLPFSLKRKVAHLCLVFIETISLNHNWRISELGNKIGISFAFIDVCCGPLPALATTTAVGRTNSWDLLAVSSICVKLFSFRVSIAWAGPFLLCDVIHISSFLQKHRMMTKMFSVFTASYKPDITRSPPTANMWFDLNPD